MCSAARFHLDGIRHGHQHEAPVPVSNVVLGLVALLVFLGRAFIEPLA